MTGRIWRLKYTASDRPQASHRLDSVDWAQTSYILSALGSPQQSIRDKAANILLKQGNQSLPDLTQYAAGESGSSGKDSLGAASALWTLVRIGTPESALRGNFVRARGIPMPQVRRLVMNLFAAAPTRLPTAGQVAEHHCGSDPDPAVQHRRGHRHRSSRTRSALGCLKARPGARPPIRTCATKAARLGRICHRCRLRQAALVRGRRPAAGRAGDDRLFLLGKPFHEAKLALAALNKALANPGGFGRRPTAGVGPGRLGRNFGARPSPRWPVATTCLSPSAPRRSWFSGKRPATLRKL